MDGNQFEESSRARSAPSSSIGAMAKIATVNLDGEPDS
jgi:hypothetical protein